MSYYRLMDPVRRDDVVRAEGRKHYVYSFGPCRWVRTTVMMDYMNPRSPLYRQYQSIEEDAARELVLQKARALSQLFPKARHLVQTQCAQACNPDGTSFLPFLEETVAGLEDLEQKLTACCTGLLQCGASPASLQKAGFSPRILQAARILADAGQPDALPAIRSNALARAVRIRQLEQLQNVPVDSPQAILDQASRAGEEYHYLSLDRPQPPRQTAAAPVFVPALQVYRKVRAGALEGRKIPHGLSNPVLRRENGTLYLAFFVFLYQRENLQHKQMPRPSSWIVADLSTGEICRRVDCSVQDFSSQPAGRLYSMEPEPGAVRPDLDEAYARLDQLRRSWLQQGLLPPELYQDYLQTILTATPPAYRVFYQELSNL